jgi:polysaccharide export outer membrane protein
MGDRSYALGMGDVVDVSVVGRTDFNTRARIGSDGTIVLPLLGAVTAVEKTPSQLADEIRGGLERGGFFSAPVVRVEVVGFASRYVTVLGNVGNPGLLPLDRTYRLSEIMARVGGRASGGGDYVVLTRIDGTSKRYKISDLAVAIGDADPAVAAGDKIFIPAAENEVFYLTGAVKDPGMYQLNEGMTVRLAIARGGGVSDMGSEGKVKITRKGKQLKGVKLDETVIEAGDIIKIGERLF